jgi:hypothetical protein
MLSEFIAQIILRARTITAKIISRRKELALTLLAARHGWNFANISENFEVALCHDETVWHTTVWVIAVQVIF